VRQIIPARWKKKIQNFFLDLDARIDSTLFSSGKGLRELYERLPSIDFSRAIIQSAESGLRVIPAPNCGWAELGTPQRVAATSRSVEYVGADPEATPRQRAPQPQR